MAQDPLLQPEMTRLALHELLLLMTAHVYFQKPSNINMEYPCIIYEQDDEVVQYADNVPYLRTTRWQLTVVDPDPDGILRVMVASLPKCAFDRRFAADDLHHTIYNLFF